MSSRLTIVRVWDNPVSVDRQTDLSSGLLLKVLAEDSDGLSMGDETTVADNERLDTTLPASAARQLWPRFTAYGAWTPQP